MDTVLPNLTSLEHKIKDAVDELQRLKKTSGGSFDGGGVSSKEKKAIRDQIQKIINLIEETEGAD
tara:strand:- start:204 stop:398 length:195 start_codon:yes stop_codon:yes gene_type:complete